MLGIFAEKRFESFIFYSDRLNNGAVKIKNNAVIEARLNIFEPPRFFEAFLRGRKFTEAPDITARICGICPVAYQMSSSHAMEQICGVKVDGQLRGNIPQWKREPRP